MLLKTCRIASAAGFLFPLIYRFQRTKQVEIHIIYAKSEAETLKVLLKKSVEQMTAVRLQENHVRLNTYKFDIKHKIEQIKKLSGDLVRMVSAVYKDNEDVQISFGETSDILLDKITNELYGEL